TFGKLDGPQEEGQHHSLKRSKLGDLSSEMRRPRLKTIEKDTVGISITGYGSCNAAFLGGHDRLKRSLMNSGSQPEAVLGPGAVARCSTTTRRSTSPFR